VPKVASSKFRIHFVLTTSSAKTPQSNSCSFRTPHRFHELTEQKPFPLGAFTSLPQYFGHLACDRIWTLRPCRGQAPNRHGLSTVRRSFLDLPAEIRNQIYQLSLVSTGPVRLKYSYCPTKNCSHLASRDKTIFTPLFKVCRKLQQEASSFVHAQNRFRFERLLDARFFFITTGPANCRFLTRFGRITITYRRSGWLPWSPGTRSEFALQPFVHKDDERVERIQRLYQEGSSTTKIICELSKLPSVRGSGLQVKPKSGQELGYGCGEDEWEGGRSEYFDGSRVLFRWTRRCRFFWVAVTFGKDAISCLQRPQHVHLACRETRSASITPVVASLFLYRKISI
jgi:hypothetical protein